MWNSNPPTSVVHSEMNARENKVNKFFALGNRAYSVVNRNYRLRSKAIPGYLMSSVLGIIKRAEPGSWAEPYFHHFLITGLHSFLLLSSLIATNQHPHLKNPSLLPSYASACSWRPFERFLIRGCGSYGFWASLPLRFLLKCATPKTSLEDWCRWYSINWFLTYVERYSVLFLQSLGSWSVSIFKKNDDDGMRVNCLERPPAH